MSTMHRAERRAGVLFVLPALVGLSLFVIGPVISSFIISLEQYNVLQPARFIGLANYRALPKDDLFWTALGNSVYISVIGVPLGMLVAMGLALLLNRRVRGIAIFRTVFYLPSITPAVAAAILWQWILNSQWGLLNSALSLLQINGPQWLGDPAWSKPSIILLGLWGTGASMIIYLAGLQGIPEVYYDAASLDGAGAWQRFWRITLPLMTPTIFFTLIVGMIGSLQIFTESYILTQGGPLNSTLFYVYQLFNEAFVYFKMGYASAMAWVLLIIILAITLVQFRLARTWVYYEGGQRQ